MGGKNKKDKKSIHISGSKDPDKFLAIEVTFLGIPGNITSGNKTTIESTYPDEIHLRRTGNESKEELEAEPSDTKAFDDEKGIRRRRIVILDDLSFVVKSQVNLVMLKLRKSFDAENDYGGHNNEY